MLLILFAILSLNEFKFANLLENVTPYSVRSHQTCLRSIPQQTTTPQAYAALLCGENITDDQIKKNLIRTSLIHLFVVSGSHLVWIENLLQKIAMPVVFRFLVAGLYSLLCNWQAPVVRAWISLGLKQFLRGLGFSLPHDLAVFYTGLMSLILFPQWILSRGFLMSWLAALALSVGSLFKMKNKMIRMLCQAVCIYILMLPVLWGFGNLHPLSIVFNLALAPIVSLVLLPLALLSTLIHRWCIIFDTSFQLFQFLSERLSEPVQFETTTPLSLGTLWGFLFFLHIGLHIFRIYTRRKSI